MDSQVSKKRTESPSRKRFCASCHKEKDKYVGDLCESCFRELEIIKNARRKNDLPFTEELVLPKGNNSVYDIIELFKLLLYNDRNNLSDSLNHERKLVSFCKNILNSESSIQVFFYFCKNGAATAKILEVQLSMKYQTVYRIINALSNMGIIFPVHKIKTTARSKKGGPRCEVWSLTGADNDAVAECIRLHKRCNSPKYRLAEEIIPTILGDFILKRNLKEITKRELIQYVKDTNLVQFNAHDIVELAIPMIQSKGIKVWR